MIPTISHTPLPEKQYGIHPIYFLILSSYCALSVHLSSSIDLKTLFAMSAPSASDVNDRKNSSRQDEEAQIIRRQIHTREVPVSFFTLFRYATASDLVVIAISTTCALAAGAIIPLPPVQQHIMTFHSPKSALLISYADYIRSTILRFCEY